MRNIVNSYIEKFKGDHRKARRMALLLSVLALLVTGVVFWRLHFTGIALANETFCGLTEHTHSEDCYDEEGNLICGLEEHTHSLACLSDSSADTETASDWEATLPTDLSGSWAEDLIAVAESQLGYTESTANFTVAEDGEARQGYTRYGAWAGNEYGDWDAMFASFCLSYAGISTEDFPEATGAYAWTVSLKEMNLYEEAADYTPVSGDLVFLDTDNDGKTDRVVILVSVDEDNNTITVIQGDYAGAAEETDAVCEVSHALDAAGTVDATGKSDDSEASDESETSGELESLDESENSGELESLDESETSGESESLDESETSGGSESLDESETSSESESQEESVACVILGYGTVAEAQELAENGTTAVLSQQTFTVEADDAVITVDGMLPEGGTVTAEPVDVEIENKNVLLAFDIVIYDENGSEYEPEAETVCVTITSSTITVDSEVYYVPEKGEPEQLENVSEEGTVVFEAEHFSVYAVTSTDAVEATGTITSTEGNTLTWTVYKDSETGDRTLVISGEGTIPDYTSGTLTPWYSYCNTTANTVKLVVEDGITAIGKYAFHQSYISEVDFPDTLTSIGDYAFCYSRSLTSVTIPDSVTYIGASAFQYSHLEEITLGSSVQTIGSFAFYATYSGSGLTVYLPDSLTSFGTDAFNQACAYEISDTNTNFKVIDGVLYSYDGTTLIDYPKYKVLNTYTVPSEVTTIATGALRYVLYVNNLVIDHAVTFQNSGYSMSNSNYQSIYLADGIVITGNAAFLSDTNLTEIRLPEGTTFTLNVSSLGGDSSLSYLKIPDGTTSIQNQSLSGLTGLETLYYDATSASAINSNVFGGTSAISYELIVGTSVDTLPAGFTYLVENASMLSFEGPNAFYVTDGALASAPAPFTGLSGWLYVDEYGAVYQLDTDNDTATLIYVPDTYTDDNGETQKLTEYTVPASFAVSGESNAEANAAYTVTTVASNALKYADNLTAITFEDVSGVTLEAYALANCETLKSVTNSVTSTTVTSEENAEKLGFASVGTNAFYNTGLTSTRTVLTEETLDGSSSISAGDTNSNITVTVSSGGAGTWTDGTAVGTGGYVALTGEEVVVTTTVANTTGTAQTYRLYFSSTDSDFSANHGPGETWTQGNITITCVQDPNDPYSYYYEFTLAASETITLDLTCSYPNASDGGGLTVTCAVMETDGNGTVTGTQSASEKELQVWWKTERDDYTLAKTNGSQSSVQIKADKDGAYLASNLQYSITLTQNADKNSNLGEDYITSVEYSDVITLPAGVTWDEEVLEAIRSGSYTRSSGDTVTFSVGGTTVVTLAMTKNVGLLLQKATLSVNDSGQVVLNWTVKNTFQVENSTDDKNLKNNTFTVTVASTALDVTLSSDDPNEEVFNENDNKVSNTVASTVHYTFSEDVVSRASADKELTTKAGNVAVSKSTAGTVTYLGEDLTYEVSIYNDGTTDYTYNSSSLTGSYTYYDTLPDAVYISASNMELMFQEAAAMGTPLTVTITGAVLGVSEIVTDADDENKTAYVNSGNTSSDTETENNTITITCERTGTEGNYIYTYSISVTDESGTAVTVTTSSGTDLETLLQGIGYGVTRSAVYTCTWTLKDQTSITGDPGSEKNTLTIKAGETLNWSIYSTIKSTFQYLQDSDWPTQYPKDTSVTVTNTAAYLMAPDGKTQIKKTGSVSKSVKREAVIGKSVYDSEGKLLDSAVSAADEEALTYKLTFTHYGDGSYDDLAMVDDLYGNQYLLVKVIENNSNQSITDYLWTATPTEPEWSGIGVTTVTIDGVDYYVLGEGTYKDVVVGTYMKSDDASTGTLIASNITVTLSGNETEVTLGGTAYTYSGVHTEIDWYFDELDGGNYTITVDYQALVDYDDQPYYTIGNVIWMNDRTGSRIYSSLWGGGTIINYDKEIVTKRTDAGDPSKDVIDDDDESEVGEGDTVTYRLTLYSTGDPGATFKVTGANIADALPSTYGTFVWSEDNVKITDVVAVVTAADKVNNTVTGYDTLKVAGNWSVTDTWNNLTSDGQYYIIWNDDVSITFTGNATVYVYVELTFPKNGDTVTTASGTTTTAWDDYVAAVGGTTVSNTFYVYRNPATVTHILKEEGSATLTKGVYTLAQSSSSLKTTSGNVNLYPSGTTRTNYNNEDSYYRYVWYYVEVYNDANSRLYLNDLYDTLPEGFTYVMMGATGDVRDDGRLTYISAKSNVGTTVSSADTNTRHWLVEQVSGIKYMSATVTASTLADGTVVFSISAGDGGTYSVKYDDEMGQYYLDHGESIVFGYVCQIDTYANTEDNATNTIAMSYTDYTDAGGVNVADDHEVTGKDFSVDGGTTTWYNGNTNDGSTDVKNSSQISYDDGKDNEYWLVSTVTVSRGSIVPGVSKSTVAYRYVNSTDPSRKTYENSVNSGAVIYWKATFSNSGTMAIYDYTVTDVMPEPFVFTEEVTYEIVDSTGTSTSSGSLFLFPEATAVTALASGDTVTITYTTVSGTTATADITVGGAAVDISSENGEFSVRLYMSDEGETDEGDVVLEIHFTDTVWSIPEGGYMALSYASYNPTNVYDNKTYINNVTLTPVLQDFDYAQSGKITSDGEGVYATSPVTVSTGSSTSSWKTVQEKGQSQTATSSEEDNSIVLTAQDSIFTYTLSVKNDSTDYAITNLVIIDNLPVVGDHLTYASTDRGSEYAVILADDPNFTVTISSPTEITSTALTKLYGPGDTDADGNTVTTYIYTFDVYTETTSTSGTFYMVEYSDTSSSAYLGNIVHDHGDVNDTDMWEYKSTYAVKSTEDVTAIRIIIRDDTGLIIPAGATVSVSFDAQVKPTVTTTVDPITGVTTTTTEYPDPGLTAWNNFGYDYMMSSSTPGNEVWLQAMPLEVGVQVPSAPKLEKKLVDLDGNAYTATEDTEFTFIIYEGGELKDTNNNNRSYDSLDDLKAALDAAAISYKEITVTVEAGDSDSGYVNLEGSGWSDWTWTQGSTYTIAEFLTGSDYSFKSWSAANGTTGDVANGSSYTFTYDREKTLYLAAANTCNDWDIELTKADKDSYDDASQAYTTFLNGAVFALYSAEQGGIYQEVQNAIANGTVPAGTTTYETTEASNGTAGVDVPLTLTVGDGSSAVTWYLYAVQTTASVTQTGQTDPTEGFLSFNGLTAESYYLVEIQAPSGYNLDSTPQQLLREDTKDNSYALTVTNNPGAKLPKTGGAGRWAFTLAGVLLIGGAACLYLWRRRRARA